MRYILRTNTGYKHLAKKLERALLAHVGRDGLKMAFVDEVFLFVSVF